MIPLALQIIIIKVVSGQGLDLRESRFDTKYALLLHWSEMKVVFHYIGCSEFDREASL